MSLTQGASGNFGRPPQAIGRRSKRQVESRGSKVTGRESKAESRRLQVVGREVEEFSLVLRNGLAPVLSNMDNQRMSGFKFRVPSAGRHWLTTQSESSGLAFDISGRLL